MKLPRRRFLHLAAGAAALPVMLRIATTETYASRPITMIVPYPAGGPTDTIARLLAERMRASLGSRSSSKTLASTGGNISVGRVAHRLTMVIRWASSIQASTSSTRRSIAALRLDV